MSAGIICLVIPSSGVERERIVTGRASLGLQQPGSSDGQLEYLHHLGADTAGKFAISADRVLTSDAALFMRGCAKREIRIGAQDAMPRLDAISRRINSRNIGFHPPVDANCSANARL